jgi:SAM-dependent methyltransferase
VLACLLRPESGGGLRGYLIDVGVVAALGATFFLFESRLDPWSLGTIGSAIFCVVVALVFAGFRKRPVGLTLAFGILLFSAISADKIEHQLYRQRSFFGVYTVAASDGRHDLYHGNITHGDQYMDDESVGTPTSYYNREGPLGQVFAAMRAVQPLKHVACVGLGTGTTACYQEPGQTMTFFEVDPAMARIARNPRLFRYLELYGENVNVVFGDGRQSISRVADGTFDLIVLDAFSSDAIPVHLLTREALAIYMRKLAPGGIVLFHISNRYVDLEPVLANLAADAGYSALLEDYDPNEAERDSGGSASTWVAVARNDTDLALLATDDRWGPPLADDRVGLWTDDYSDLFRTLLWRELLRLW